MIHRPKTHQRSESFKTEAGVPPRSAATDRALARTDIISPIEMCGQIRVTERGSIRRVTTAVIATALVMLATLIVTGALLLTIALMQLGKMPHEASTSTFGQNS